MVVLDHWLLNNEEKDIRLVMNTEVNFVYPNLFSNNSSRHFGQFNVLFFLFEDTSAPMLRHQPPLSKADVQAVRLF